MNNTTTKILELKGLDKIYAGGLHAVKGLNYSVRRGSINAFLGPNGAGKTTTLRMVCGLCKPTGGDIIFNGIEVNHIPASYRRSIGVMSQHLNLELDLSVYANLKVHALLYGMKNTEIPTRISNILKHSGLSDKRDTRIRELSGGIRRRVQIARALMHDPELIILDEPTVGLDPASRNKIWQVILNLKKAGKTIIFSTHYMEEANQYAEYISIVHKGSVIKEGKPEKLIKDEGTWCRIFCNGNNKQIRFFADKQAAESAMLAAEEDCGQLIIRRTSLEDVFLKLTGEELNQ